MENLTSLKMQRSFSGLILTRENLCIASTLIAPLVLLGFLPVESVLILITLALFLSTIIVFHIKKDRDNWMHSLEICRDLLEEETRKLEAEKNKCYNITVNCMKSHGTPEKIISV
ncbi:MAG: hypothetical protein JW749_11105 [Sedimentisphaerales bacterium]|nr:hypothetical protein [Sedimentisphaerales bacterium]